MGTVKRTLGYWGFIFSEAFRITLRESEMKGWIKACMIAGIAAGILWVLGKTGIIPSNAPVIGSVVDNFYVQLALGIGAVVVFGVGFLFALVYVPASVHEGQVKDRDNEVKQRDDEIKTLREKWEGPIVHVEPLISIFNDPPYVIGSSAGRMGIWVENPVTGKPITNLTVALNELFYIKDSGRGKRDRLKDIGAANRLFLSGNVADISSPIYYGKSNRRLIYIGGILTDPIEEFALYLPDVFHASEWNFVILATEDVPSDSYSESKWSSSFEIGLRIDGNLDNRPIDTIYFKMWVEYERITTHWYQDENTKEWKKAELTLPAKIRLSVGELSDEYKNTEIQNKDTSS